MSPSPWTPERELDVEGARALIAEAFPELSGLPVAAFGAGWDNTVFLVGDAWVFRFPRRQLAVELLEVECAVLPGLVETLPLAVPAPRFLGRPSDAFPWPFAGYAQVPGTTADRARLDDSERCALAPALAGFLRALHATSPPSATPPDRIRRVDLAYRVPKVQRELGALVAAGLVQHPLRLEPILEALPPGWAPRDDVLVHGDLYSRHLIVDAARRATGVIDWGDVHRGDPAIDLALVEGLLPAAGRAAFYAGYGETTAETRAVARFRALHHALALLAYGNDTADADLVHEARWTLDNLALDPSGER